jgi:hypothetical protein
LVTKRGPLSSWQNNVNIAPFLQTPTVIRQVPTSKHGGLASNQKIRWNRPVILAFGTILPESHPRTPGGIKT